MTTYYKCLRTGREATHVAGFYWPQQGEWLEVEGELVPCKNGLHVTNAENLLTWLCDELWIVEVAGEEIDAGNKTVVRRARLVRQVPDADRRLRLFAADCAEHVLHLFERKRPKDKRPRRAIKAARAYANNEISVVDLGFAEANAWNASAESKDHHAAEVAAMAAAEAACWSPHNNGWWNAIDAAVGAAHWGLDAASSDAEREWQTARMLYWLEAAL